MSGPPGIGKLRRVKRAVPDTVLAAIDVGTNAVRLEMTIEPPVDGVAGAHYEAVATTDGINPVEDYEPSPPCAG